MTPAHAPLRLLLADAGVNFAALFRRRLGELKEWDVTIDQVFSGSELPLRVVSQPYDLVFLDLGLPGFDVLDFLSRMGQTSLPLPMVVLSEKNEARIAVEAMKRGVLDHILKDDFASLDVDAYLVRLTETFRLRRENVELRQISEMKNDFLATISHELRTPLTSILGLSELMLSGRMGPLVERQKESLQKVIDQSQNLARLINQLLDVQDTLRSRRPADSRPMDALGLVRDRVEMLRPLFAKKGVGLSEDFAGADLWVSAPRETLQKVFDHLLLNALKFTPGGGAVSVRVAEWSPGVAGVSIHDTGQGIPKEALPFVFQKFFHVDPGLTRPYGGLGLGLAYCQYVVESSGGRIWVESPGLGMGTTVTFTLPRVGPEVGDFRPPDANRTVLWVDDNENMLELMEVGFSSLPESVHLVTRSSGQAALEEAFARPPDLIVLDIMMPDMNGLEVLARLKADRLTQSIPVLVVTGYRESAEESLLHGAAGYFLKPFHVPEILSKVCDYLKIPAPPRN